MRISYTLSRVLTRNFFGSKTVRVRFAPSPTGPMHIGGLRTALVNYLFARQNAGQFILRIEDTDKSRCSSTSLKEIYECLNWSGLRTDEDPLRGGACSPYIQSERKDIYRQYADRLLQSGHAYPCFCSPERLDMLRKEQRRRGEVLRYDNRCRNLSKAEVDRALSQNRPCVIRFKLPSAPTTLNDLVFHQVNFPNADLEGDLVIMKSDGMPVYHFANVVDDHLMRITHVIRGSEWISSFPKHLKLYEAFGWDPPAFAHIPLMLSSSGKKFSKRSSDPLDISSVSSLRRRGYLPSAVLTWISATGGLFSFPFDDEGIDDSSSDKNVFWSSEKTVDEMLDSFDLSALNRHHGRVSQPLLHICGLSHFDRFTKFAAAELSTPSPPSASPYICSKVRDFLLAALPPNNLTEEFISNDAMLVEILVRLRGRISCLSDLTTDFLFLWQRPNVNDDSFRRMFKTLKSSDVRTGFSSVLNAVSQILLNTSSEHLTDQLLTTYLETVLRNSEFPSPESLKALRVCLTGSEVGMPVRELIGLLSPRESSYRIQTALSSLKEDSF